MTTYKYEKTKNPDLTVQPGDVFEQGPGGRRANHPVYGIFRDMEDSTGYQYKVGIPNQGGIITKKVNNSKDELAFIVIQSNKYGDKDPRGYHDSYNPSTNLLTYYGDQDKDKKDPDESSKLGNKYLTEVFKAIAGQLNEPQKKICPILYFETYLDLGKRTSSMKYIGMAVPLSYRLPLNKCIEEFTNSVGGRNKRFQFEIQPVSFNKRWVGDLRSGKKLSSDFQTINWEMYLLSRLKKIESTNSDANWVEEINYGHIIPTGEGEALTKYRRGQNEIRKALLEERGHKCELCDISYDWMLIASHALGWKEYSEKRGDLDNLLLLCRNHDAMFDGKFISFDSNGKIIISNLIKKSDYSKLKLEENFNLEKFSLGQKEIFREHRKKLKTK